MRKKICLGLTLLCLVAIVLTGCETKEQAVVPQENSIQETQETDTKETESVADEEGEIIDLADGEYQVNVTMTGGSGRASIQSPTTLKVLDGQAYATIIWSSKYYDYMLVDDVRYENEAEGADDNSTFTIPVERFMCEIPVIGDTTAMSKPHEVEYTFYYELVDLNEK